MSGGRRNVRVVSWNVNGLRAIAGKGFVAHLHESDADLYGVQETRASKDQLAPELAAPSGYELHLVSGERAGYSGVGLYSRLPVDEVESGLGKPRFDREGRLQFARVGRLVVINGYFPNGNGKGRDNSRVPYKLAFYRAVLELAQRQRRAGHRVLVLGDFNTAHREIDLARAKENKNTSGFLEVEREAFDAWIRAGWVDSFRAFQPGPDHYSWWSQRGTARARNIGWRIDYVLCSPNVVPFLRDGFIWPTVSGSDHCPVGVDLDRDVLG